MIAVAADEAQRRWSDVVGRHCPVAPADSLWRQSGPPRQALPRQGWKIHVSATPLNAAEVLDIAASVLTAEGLPFKAVSTMSELRKLNCGLYYGHSQIGKAVTAYPGDAERCVRVAHLLARLLKGQCGPAVPFERRVAEDSPVFARYGVIVANGDDQALLRRPDGSHEPDRRDAHPSWVDVPDGLFTAPDSHRDGPLSTGYRAYGFISQRGKGGVYRALDLTTTPPRLCVLKEGRQYGEVELDGQDGRSRVGREADIVESLARDGVPVPELYSSFEQGGNRYLVFESMPGGSLAEHIWSHRNDPIDLPARVDLCLQVALLVAHLHRLGWVWRDLKPANLLVDESGQLRPIDFEGTARSGSRADSPWGSPGHLPPEWLSAPRVSVTQDRYALGVVMRQILAHRILGNPHDSDGAIELDASVPTTLRTLIDRLTANPPTSRPSASSAVRTIRGAHRSLAADPDRT